MARRKDHRIEINGPGDLSIFVGIYQLASLSAGKIVRSKGDAHKQFYDVFTIFLSGLDEISSLIRRMNPTDTKAIQTSDIWGAYENTLFSILNVIEQNGHGGTLLIRTPRRSRERTKCLRIKYPLANATFLRDSFARYCAIRHSVETMDADAQRQTPQPFDTDRRSLHVDRRAARRELNSTATTIAGFSSVDGAVLIGADLKCFGFGCEIITELTKPTKLYSSDGKDAPIRVENYGMRHRSAVRLVGEMPGVIALVCSQDGGAKMYWKDEMNKVRERRIRPANFDFPLVKRISRRDAG